MIIKAFSVYTNGRTIFTTTTPTPDHLSCLNGLKFISMMWIVLGHQFSIPIYGSITNTKYVLQWTDKLHSMVLISATLSVDTFFTISGVLMSYGFMKTKYRSTRFNILFYYCHRYVRLTAPLVPVVLVSATLLKYLGSGPKWPYMFLYFQKNCQLYWWSTLLYVQNYVNISNMVSSTEVSFFQPKSTVVRRPNLVPQRRHAAVLSFPFGTLRVIQVPKSLPTFDGYHHPTINPVYILRNLAKRAVSHSVKLLYVSTQEVSSIK